MRAADLGRTVEPVGPRRLGVSDRSRAGDQALGADPGRAGRAADPRAPYGILDCPREGAPPAGCKALRDAILRARPRLVVFGHIHTRQGIVRDNGITYANVSLLDNDYRRSGRGPVPMPDLHSNRTS